MGLGGFIGAILRALVNIYTQKLGVLFFPFSTFLVNIVGSFFIGVLMAYAQTKILPEFLRAVLVMGLLGSFTTFSTFAWENFLFLKNGQFIFAIINIFLSLLFGILAVKLGFLIFK